MYAVTFDLVWTSLSRQFGRAAGSLQSPLLVLVMATCLFGCSDFILVEARVAHASAPLRPEVLRSDALDSYARAKNVVLSAPDWCVNQAASESTGAATGTGSIVQTSCGVEMGEIQNALKRQGFSVGSWREVREAVVTERVTARAAAKRLGAEVLFQVNSLQRVTLAPSRRMEWTVRYFDSDSHGSRGSVRSVSSSDSAQLLKIVEARQERLLTGESAPRVLGAMLDVDAIAVDSGESIWSFRAQHFSAQTNAAGISVLVARRTGQWDVVEPDGESDSGDHAPKGRGTIGADGVAFAAGGPDDPTGAEYHELIRGVCEEFAKRFRADARASGDDGS